MRQGHLWALVWGIGVVTACGGEGDAPNPYAETGDAGQPSATAGSDGNSGNAGKGSGATSSTGGGEVGGTNGGGVAGNSISGSGGVAGGGGIAGNAGNAGMAGEPEMGGDAGMGGQAGETSGGTSGSAGMSGSGGMAGTGGAGGSGGSGGAGGTGGGGSGGTAGNGGGGNGGTGGGPMGPTSVLQAAVGNLIVTEIMPNPSKVSDTKGEWFEIYNTTDHDIDLNGLKVADSDGSSTVSSTLVIASHSYLVFARSGSANGGVTAAFVYGDNLQLANGPDSVQLSVPGTVIDTVAYTASFPLLIGESMTLKPGVLDGTANDAATSWCGAPKRFGDGDLGSPGAANVGCLKPSTELMVGSLVVTEIMANPAAVADTLGEWFEILNPTEDAFDLKNLSVADADVDKFDVTASLIIPSGERRVFGLNGTQNTNGGIQVDYVYSQLSFTLANGIDEIVLSRGATIIDKVTWNATSSGISSSLDPQSSTASANDSLANWCSATTVLPSKDKATPRAPNDECP